MHQKKICNKWGKFAGVQSMDNSNLVEVLMYMSLSPDLLWMFAYCVFCQHLE
jgi:hypothetical protein